jgi:hypothetical protein
MANPVITYKNTLYQCGFYSEDCYTYPPMINFAKIQVPGEDGKRFFSARVVGGQAVCKEELLRQLLNTCLEKEAKK